MIISVSRKTDIPAHYADWFREQLKNGRSRSFGYNGEAKEVLLTPDHVDAFVFWSKDFTRFTGILKELENSYEKRFILQYTITGLNAACEPVTKSREREERIIENFLYLAARYPRQVQWRFDPIIYTDSWGHNYYLDKFQNLLNRLRHPANCFISFVQEYRKIKPALKQINYTTPTDQDKQQLAGAMVRTAPRIRIFACCNPVLEQVPGVQRAACIDGELLYELFGRGPSPKAPTRKGCGCSKSIDIGRYGTCRHACIYCYAQ